MIYFKGPTSPIAPKSEFSISVLLDTEASINAFDLEINYPKDKLEFLSFDNTDSIVNIWQPAPRMLENGNLGLSGGIVKAWKGEEGIIIKLSFRALDEGVPKITFTKNNLYIADGKATEVKAEISDLSFSIKENAKVVSTPSIPFAPTPENILIQKELENYESRVVRDKMLLPLIIFLVIIFVICVWAVYNKYKRKL